jgi:cell division protease FtsH
MVMEYGMSDELGTMTFGEREELVFLGRNLSEHRNYSEAVARKIDSEIREIVGEAHRRASGVMTTYREALDAMAHELMERETLGEAEVAELLGAA